MKVIFPFSIRLNKCFALIHGYCNEEESRHDSIDVGRVVVVVRVAVVVDIIEVGGVGDIRRTLPPVISTDPTALTPPVRPRTLFYGI